MLSVMAFIFTTISKQTFFHIDSLLLKCTVLILTTKQHPADLLPFSNIMRTNLLNILCIKIKLKCQINEIINLKINLQP